MAAGRTVVYEEQFIYRGRPLKLDEHGGKAMTCAPCAGLPAVRWSAEACGSPLRRLVTGLGRRVGIEAEWRPPLGQSPAPT